ncbi:MAG TPA: class II aldolase/adducin family protein, partial [Caulobacteraceae bacterium]|nr:class II aldolase/adducin family protein [Caulobacteraceae bacterium]
MTDIAMFREGSREPNRTDPPKEHELRRDLAAAYRLAALFGWDDLIATHFSVRLPSAPGEPEAFLLNQYGILFEEITASSLVKVDVEGDILSDSDEPVNKAGFVVHSAVHQARPDAGCVMHLHTEDGVAVSALDEGLLPLNQTAMIVAGRVSVHEYEGVAVDLGERERLVADLGDNDLMFLRNHGTLAVGATVAEAFSRMYTLEKACTFQVKTLGMGRPCRMPDPAVVDKMKAGPRRNEQSAAYARNYVWPALLRKLDRL